MSSEERAFRASMLKFAVELIARGYPGPWVRKALAKSTYPQRAMLLLGSQKREKPNEGRVLRMVKLYTVHGPSLRWLKKSADTMHRYIRHDTLKMSETVGTNIVRSLCFCSLLTIESAIRLTVK